MNDLSATGWSEALGIHVTGACPTRALEGEAATLAPWQNDSCHL